MSHSALLPPHARTRSSVVDPCTDPSSSARPVGMDRKLRGTRSRIRKGQRNVGMHEASPVREQPLEASHARSARRKYSNHKSQIPAQEAVIQVSDTGRTLRSVTPISKVYLDSNKHVKSDPSPVEICGLPTCHPVHLGQHRDFLPDPEGPDEDCVHDQASRHAIPKVETSTTEDVAKLRSRSLEREDLERLMRLQEEIETHQKLLKRLSQRIAMAEKEVGIMLVQAERYEKAAKQRVVTIRQDRLAERQQSSLLEDKKRERAALRFSIKDISQGQDSQ